MSISRSCEGRAKAVPDTTSYRNCEKTERESAMDDYGPLTKKVIEYQDTVRGLVPDSEVA